MAYLDELELGYILYSRTSGGKGVTKVNRLRLVIHPDNAASKRIAEKTGFSFESVARGAWWHRGRNHDVEVWSLLRSDR